MEDSQPNSSNIFSVRIVSLDYYMSPPIPGVDISYSSFQGGKVNEVPVIRVYGSTPAGQKTCLHIHRALPYFYVPCSGLFLQSDGQGDACTHALSQALEKVLKLKGNAGTKRQHVHGCDLVRAKKFYGYHYSEELFVKIYLYHPQDVRRAANLLLEGRVLDKALQPHESHIPFLLQFLVDYNLYGMGHLHLSKLKFRYPVPDSYSQRNISESGLMGENTDDTARMAAKSQVDYCGDLPIWITSTIPDGWNWQYPSERVSASDQEIPQVKRQSTSELEGDAILEDILNHHYISYTSLSQTHSEMKMVPSLIPIWEEFERSGMQEGAMPPDPGKPLPRDVLRTLCNGLGFGNDAESSSSLEKSINTSTNEENPETQPVDGSTKDPPNFLNTSNKMVLMPLDLSLEGDGMRHGEDINEGPNKSSIDQLQRSENVSRTELKASDQDALTLLKWLASSQAAEDMNSDDELTRETILSPFLPSTTVDKVLEKANMDYESESQQECQDILDSVDDVLIFNVSNRDVSHSTVHADSSRHVSTHRIPQVDGSGDETPHTDKYKLNNGSKISQQVQFRHDVLSDINDRKRKRPQWGSLPVALSKRLDDFPPHSCVWDAVIGSDSDLKDSVETSVLSKDEPGECCSNLKEIADNYACQWKEVGECSMRDMMRRKRCYRVETPGYNTVHVRESLIENERNKDLSLNLELRSDEQDQRSLASLILRPSLADDQLECRDRNYKALEESYEACDSNPIKSSCMSNNIFPSSVSKDNQNSSLEAKYSESILQESAVLQKCGSSGFFQSNEEIGGLPNSFNADDPLSIVCVAHGESQRGRSMDSGTEPFAMTLYKKPPKVELGDGIRSSSQLGCNVLDDEEEDIKSFVPAGALEEYVPFFPECLEEQEIQNAKTNDYLVNQKSLLGVPRHYQNDGSYLYMLAPVSSPPSMESVTRWLSFDGADTLKENIPAAKALPSPKCSFPELLVHSQASEPDVNGPMVEMVYGSDSSHNEDNKETSKVKKKFSVDDVRRLQHNEGNSLGGEASGSYYEDISQLSGPESKSKLTPLSQMGFRDPANVGGGQQLTLMSIEILAESRGDLRPDPRFDAIDVVVLVIQRDDDCGLNVHILLHCSSDPTQRNLDGIPGSEILVFSDEMLLLRHLSKAICSSDPDILLGWDVQRESLGFLAERAAFLGINLLNRVSRTPFEVTAASECMNGSDKGKQNNVLPESVNDDSAETAVIEDEWGRTHASGVHVSGRIVLNVWRLIRGEVKLNLYSLEAVAEAVLRRKVPSISCKVLMKWFSSGPGRARYRCIEYIAERARLNLHIVNQLDMINRTSELARVFGIDFFSVLSRGSQYRVESMFLRLAHTQNYLAISPGNQQVAFQPAMECLPLVMEPESGFYADPVVVLDFQSLYPSMIIAYNLCFCTCLGKVIPSKAEILGVSSYSPESTVLKSLKNEILLTPNGVMYVPHKVRKGVLPRLLEEILSTRIMVKQGMKKLDPDQLVLRRIYDARQLALKLIANVTYGYTAAGFSGRMPCAELADSIVQCGRRTLESAISFVNAHEKWQAKVIYGDTDSMFVLLKGRSVEKAFQIGHEIADAITAMNPHPVTLKMDKVYHPCFLLTKKRYVGFSYESSDQSKPKFDAKGIETIRRDTCGAVAKMMEQSLKVFFEHKDIDKVKAYVLRQWNRILSGRVPLQDFVFAKEVRLGTYSARASSLPPAAIVASKAMRADPRAEPLYAERIPYVVVHGAPGSRLVDMVVDPQELLAIDSPHRLNDIYYIRKQIIPALQRAFGLVGADLNQWFSGMPRPGHEAFCKRHSSAPNAHRTRIEYYYLSKHCILCDALVQGSAQLCHNCTGNEAIVATALTGRTSKLERDIQHLSAICRHCGGGDWLTESGVKCTSLACSIYYERRKIQKELKSLSSVASEAGFYPMCTVEWF